MLVGSRWADAAVDQIKRIAVLTRDTCIDNNLMGCVVTADKYPEFIFHMMTWLDLTRMAKPGSCASH